MAEPKAQTLQARFGFADSDIKKPKHDEIMLWLDQNLDAVLTVILRKNVIGAKARWELPVTSRPPNTNYIIGFLDMVVVYGSEQICFEIKTEILSLGELLRQINMYRMHLPYHDAFVVVCPDDKFASKLKEQGVMFFKYEPDKLVF